MLKNLLHGPSCIFMICLPRSCSKFHFSPPKEYAIRPSRRQLNRLQNLFIRLSRSHVVSKKNETHHPNPMFVPWKINVWTTATKLIPIGSQLTIGQILLAKFPPFIKPWYILAYSFFTEISET